MWAKNRSKFECSEFYENSTIYHSMSEKSVHVFTDSGWNSNLAIVDYLTWINTLKSKCRWSIAICITLIKWAETWYKDNISNAVPYFPVCAISWHGVDRMCVCFRFSSFCICSCDKGICELAMEKSRKNRNRKIMTAPWICHERGKEDAVKEVRYRDSPPLLCS